MLYELRHDVNCLMSQVMRSQALNHITTLPSQSFSLDVKNHGTHVTVNEDEGEPGAATVNVNIFNIYGGSCGRA